MRYIQMILLLVFCFLQVTASAATTPLKTTTSATILMDTIPPVAICLSNLAVSLSGEDAVQIWAEDIDAGSYDLEGNVTLSIARQDADSDGDGSPEADDFGLFVEITAADTANVVYLILQVEDEAGNINRCLAELSTAHNDTGNGDDVHFDRLNCDDEITTQLFALEGDAQTDYLANLLLNGTLGQLDELETACSISSVNVLEIAYDHAVICSGVPILYHFQVVDECGNTQNQDGVLVVRPATDETPPLAICISNLTTALPAEGVVDIFALDIDEGSYDLAGDVTLTIARQDADSDNDGSPEADDFGFFVEITAADTAHTVILILRVEDEAGNISQCFSELTIGGTDIGGGGNAFFDVLNCNDEQLTQLINLEGQVQREFATNMLLDGAIGQLDELDTPCSINVVNVLDVEIGNADCRSGVITYNFKVIDECGNTLIQEGNIALRPVNDWTMQFPADIQLNDEEGAIPEVPEISTILENKGCDFWAMSVDDDYFYDNETVKIVRTYNLINWCTWIPLSLEAAKVERPSGRIDEASAVSLRYADLDFDGVNDYDDLGGDTDIYDATSITIDADFVTLENNIPVDTTSLYLYDVYSNFSNETETYVSAQAYGNIQYTQFIEVNKGSNLIVYPGDTDANGVANHFDLLPIGLSFGTPGTARQGASIEWTPQISEDWGIATPSSGIDFKHSDANGNELVNSFDIAILERNWGNTREGRSPSPNLATFSSNDIPFYVGEEGEAMEDRYILPIILGTEDIPAENVYGLAFSIFYTTDMDTNADEWVNIELNESWLGDVNEELLIVQRHFPLDNRLDVAITRKDRQSRTGNGTIAQMGLGIGIEDIILQVNNNNETRMNEIKFNIGDVRIISANEEEIDTATPETTIVITDTTTSAKETLANATKVVIYPNPVLNRLYIKSELQIEKAMILDISGKAMQINTYPKTSIDVEKLDSGMYLLQLITKEGTITKRFSIQ